MLQAAAERPPGVGPGAQFDAARGVWVEGVYWFDERAADRAAEFFPRFLRFTKGEWGGRPFVLEPWQANDIIRPLFGWKRLDDNTRRYRRCFVWVPRKNGKTELAAGVALLLLAGDGEEGAEVYAIASNKDQAEIVFSQASRMVEKSPELAADLETFKTSIYCPALNAGFKPMTGKAEGKHGYNCSALIGDEMHEWANGDLYQFLHDSQAARRQPLEFLISTAGKRGTFGEELWDECQRILDGTLEDPESLVVIYAAHPEDDWTQEATWRKANPNLGVSKKLETMRSDARRAMQSPRKLNAFLNYQLNIWTEQAVRWLPIDAEDDKGRRFGWKHCAGQHSWRRLEGILRGKRCFGGLDLSSTTDLTALAWWFPVQDGLELPACLVRLWKPADLLGEHGRRDKLPYERWAEEGALLTTPGPVIDYSFIRKQISADAEAFQIAHMGNAKRKEHEGGLAYDPWHASETVQALTDAGMPMARFRQGFASFTAPCKELERLCLVNGFQHGGHPVLQRHATVVAVEYDAADNVKPAKNKSTERIDGIVAVTMGLGLAMASQAEKAPAYQMMIF